MEYMAPTPFVKVPLQSDCKIHNEWEREKFMSPFILQIVAFRLKFIIVI